jgi:cytochrome c553
MKTKNILAGLLILGATSLFAADGATIFKSCTGCHGANAEKAALGKSEVIKGWEVEKIVAALTGYKDGSYGKAMKGVMKGQVSRLSDADMKAVAEHISTLK